MLPPSPFWPSSSGRCYPPNKSAMRENIEIRLDRRDGAAIAIILALTISFSLPLLHHPLDMVGETDWLQKASYLAAGKHSLLIYKQFPLWTPCFGGGYPFMGHPENMFYNPLLLALTLGGNEWLTMKMIAALAYCAGGAGMYLWTRKAIRYSIPGAFFSSLLFSFNSYLPFHTCTGNFMESTYYYLPLLMFLLFLAGKNLKWTIGAGLILAYNILGDGGLQVPNMFLFLALFYLSGAILPPKDNARKAGRKLNALLLSFALAILFSSIKLVPVAELLRDSPRRMESYERAAEGSAGLKTLSASLLSRGPFKRDRQPTFPDGSFADSTIYFGIIPLFFSAAAFILSWRKTRIFLPPLIVFTLLTMGNKSPVDLFRVLWHLPVYCSLRMPNKYFAFFIAFTVSATAGAVVPGPSKKRPLNLLVISVAILSSLSLFTATIPYHISLTSGPPPLKSRHTFFHVLSEREDGRHHRYEDDQYYLVLEGIGKINWYGNIYLGENAVPKFRYRYPDEKRGRFNPAYRGETFFLRGLSGAEIERWSPSILEVSVNVRENDVLIINQNYNRNWKSSMGRVIDYEGLLAVGGLPTGEHEVKLYFDPASFKIGAVISSLSLLVALVWLFLPKKKQTTD